MGGKAQRTALPGGRPLLLSASTTEGGGSGGGEDKRQQFTGETVADLCDAFAQLAASRPGVAAETARRIARSIREQLRISAPAWTAAAK